MPSGVRMIKSTWRRQTVSFQNMAMGSLRFAYVFRLTQFGVAQSLIRVKRIEAGRKEGISTKKNTICS